MEFFIQQNSTLPIIKMDVILDGKTDAGKDFYSILDNATLRFSMVCEEAYLTEKYRRNFDSPREYYIYYKWVQKDTNKKGRFVGQFLVQLEEGELVSPIAENLYINII
jgi:hypothetical protein